MCPPGLGCQPEQRRAGEALDDLEARDSGPSPARTDAHALTLLRMTPDGPVDDAGLLPQRAVRDGHVALGDRALPELSRQPLERRRRPSHQQPSRGVTVETMDDAGPFGLADAAQRAQPVEDC